MFPEKTFPLTDEHAKMIEEVIGCKPPEYFLAFLSAFGGMGLQEPAYAAGNPVSGFMGIIDHPYCGFILNMVSEKPYLPRFFVPLTETLDRFWFCIALAGPHAGEVYYVWGPDAVPIDDEVDRDAIPEFLTFEYSSLRDFILGIRDRDDSADE